MAKRIRKPEILPDKKINLDESLREGFLFQGTQSMGVRESDVIDRVLYAKLINIASYLGSRVATFRYLTNHSLHTTNTFVGASSQGNLISPTGERFTIPAGQVQGRVSNKFFYGKIYIRNVQQVTWITGGGDPQLEVGFWNMWPQNGIFFEMIQRYANPSVPTLNYPTDPAYITYNPSVVSVIPQTAAPILDRNVQGVGFRYLNGNAGSTVQVNFEILFDGVEVTLN